jgi:hypothetical protein
VTLPLCQASLHLPPDYNTQCTIPIWHPFKTWYSRKPTGEKQKRHSTLIIFGATIWVMQTHYRGMQCNLFFKNLLNTHTFTLYMSLIIAAESFTSFYLWFHYSLFSFMISQHAYEVGWDSAAGIATCYGLDGLRTESWCGAKFATPIQTGHGAHPTASTMGTGSLPREYSSQNVALTTHLYLLPRSKEV